MSFSTDNDLVGLLQRRLRFADHYRWVYDVQMTKFFTDHWCSKIPLEVCVCVCVCVGVRSRDSLSAVGGVSPRSGFSGAQCSAVWRLQSRSPELNHILFVFSFVRIFLLVCFQGNVAAEPEVLLL